MIEAPAHAALNAQRAPALKSRRTLAAFRYSSRHLFVMKTR
jgi:hypothetical protein